MVSLALILKAMSVLGNPKYNTAEPGRIQHAMEADGATSLRVTAQGGGEWGVGEHGCRLN